jgi:trigger factor
VDTANSISYEIGSGELIEGIDEALDTLTAGETTTFEAPLMGGDHEGENAQITVTLTAVKERELPDADDDFAQIASEFDTIDELRDSLREQAARSKTFGQGTAARDQLVEKLLELVEIPVPEQLVEDEVHRHLEQENRLEDDEHRAEVTESSEKTFRTQILLDEVAQAENVKVSQDELTQYLIQGAAQYGMDPNEFVKILSENGQIPSMVGEVARNKALAIILGKVKVVDTNGASVDLSEFTALPDTDEDESAAAESDAAPAADETAAESDTGEADAAPAAEEKPKKKAASKKK